MRRKNQTMVDKIPWDTCVIALIVFVLKTEHCFPYQIALLSPPPPPPSPDTMLKLWRNSMYTCPTLYGGGGGGRGWTSVDEFAPDCLFGACQMWICPKTFVHDCRWNPGMDRHPIQGGLKIFLLLVWPNCTQNHVITHTKPKHSIETPLCLATCASWVESTCMLKGKPSQQQYSWIPLILKSVISNAPLCRNMLVYLALKSNDFSSDLGPVHTYPDIFESATFSLRIRLPSTRIRRIRQRIRKKINSLSRVEKINPQRIRWRVDGWIRKFLNPMT